MKKIMLNISLLVSLVAINNTNTYNLLTQQSDYQQRVNNYDQQRYARPMQRGQNNYRALEGYYQTLTKQLNTAAMSPEQRQVEQQFADQNEHKVNWIDEHRRWNHQNTINNT